MRWTCGYLVITPLLLLLLLLQLPSSRVMGIRDEMGLEILDQQQLAEEEENNDNLYTSPLRPTTPSTTLNISSGSGLSRWKLISSYSTSSTFKPSGRYLRRRGSIDHDNPIVQVNNQSESNFFVGEPQGQSDQIQVEEDDQVQEEGENEDEEEEEEEEEEESEDDPSSLVSLPVGQQGEVRKSGVTVKDRGLVRGVESQSENLFAPPTHRNSAHMKDYEEKRGGEKEMEVEVEKGKEERDKKRKRKKKEEKKVSGDGGSEESFRPINISKISTIRHYKSRKSFQRTTKATAKVNRPTPTSILSFLSREQGDQPLEHSNHPSSSSSFIPSPTISTSSKKSNNNNFPTSKVVFGKSSSSSSSSGGRKRNSTSSSALQRIKLMSTAGRRGKWNGSSSVGESSSGSSGGGSRTANLTRPTTQVLLLPPHPPTTTKSPLKKATNYRNTTTHSSTSSAYNNISAPSPGQTTVEWYSSSSPSISSPSPGVTTPPHFHSSLDSLGGSNGSSMVKGVSSRQRGGGGKGRKGKNNNKKVSVTREVIKDFSSMTKKKKTKGKKTGTTTTMTTVLSRSGSESESSFGAVSVGDGDDEIVVGVVDHGIDRSSLGQEQSEDDDLSPPPSPLDDDNENEKEFFPVSVNVNRQRVSGVDPPNDNLDDETDMSKLLLYEDNQLLEEDSISGGGGGGGSSPASSGGGEEDVSNSSGSSLSLSSSSSKTNKPDIDRMTKFLRMVETQNTLGDNCTAGTAFNLGEGVVDRYAQERFRLEAEVAVNRANMLTRLWKYAPPQVMDSEYLLHASLFSMVEFDDDIFAAGNCYDKLEYKNYTLFCPFAYRLTDGHILVKDLAVEYKYLSNTSEWFYIARKNAQRVIKNFSQFSRGYNSYTYNESAHTPRTQDEILNVTYEDGKWSKPYFDCGGGNIWMMTYTVPFFGYKDDHYFFKGTSGIDIDLRRVDIDQCPLPDNSTELNIFAASDKCKNATTKCVPIKGLGFRRGSYRCECQVGFYFPNVSSTLKYFNGTVLEEEYERKLMNVVSLYDDESAFECLRCPVGCDSCEDDRPCVVTLNWLMRSAILILQSAIIAMLPIVGLFTWKYSDVKVVRAASPVLLRFIVLGAFFIYCTILVMYPSPSLITCTLRVWLREIGFSLAYGALMLKTWRISVIFRVRSAKAVKITDLDLMKRLGIIVSMFTALLVIRTLVAPPISIVSLTADDLKAWLCKSDWWDHSFTIMELIFLVWGIRLCIVVRKAPSEFNESKFISLAIYNEFLLSVFLNISMLFLQSPANPDLLYIIFFCHVQLTMTLLLCLIFGSKAYMVFRGHGKGNFSEDTRVPTFISKSRSGQKAKQASGHNSTTGVHSSTTSTSHAHDPNFNNSRLSEDVQEEFRRLYYQLEELKERNMRLGNRHLVAKIKAMQDAADNIWTGPMGLPPGNNERGGGGTSAGGGGVSAIAGQQQQQGGGTELLQVQGLTSQSGSGGSGGSGDASGSGSSKSNKILSDITEEDSSTGLGPWKRKRQSLLNRVRNTKKLLSLGSKSTTRQSPGGKEESASAGGVGGVGSAVNNISVLFSPTSSTVKTLQRVLPGSIVEKVGKVGERRQGSIRQVEEDPDKSLGKKTGTMTAPADDDEELPHGGVYIGELNPVTSVKVTKCIVGEKENASLPSHTSSSCSKQQQPPPLLSHPLQNEYNMDKGEEEEAEGSVSSSSSRGRESCRGGGSVRVIAQVNLPSDADGGDDHQVDDDNDEDDNVDESIELDMEEEGEEEEEDDDMDIMERMEEEEERVRENIPMNLIRRRRGRSEESGKLDRGTNDGSSSGGGGVGGTTERDNNDDDGVSGKGDRTVEMDKKKKMRGRVKEEGGGEDKIMKKKTGGSGTRTTTTRTTGPTTSSSSSHSHSRSGNSSKIVLDLDDKSRFTEEITV